MSHDPIRQYLREERTQRRRRIAYAALGWLVVILSAAFMVWLVIVAITVLG